jgi:hypothetical protein
MQAIVRRCRSGAGSVKELVARVESQFVGESSSVPDGIAGFQAIDAGDRTITTIALFEPGQDRADVERRVRARQPRSPSSSSTL